MNERPVKFIRPGRLAVLVNRIVLLGGKLGISLMGSRTLTVRGRKSGQPRSTPVNPVLIVNRRYLVAARGTTEWVRNLRGAGEGELSLRGRSTRFTAREIDDDAKLPVLRAYIATWGWEVGAFFDLPRNPTTVQLRQVAPLHPVFEITDLPPGR